MKNTKKFADVDYIRDNLDSLNFSKFKVGTVSQYIIQYNTEKVAWCNCPCCIIPPSLLKKNRGIK